MKAQDLACGVWPLTEDAIKRYVDEHGRKPSVLVLHPARVEDFARGSESNPELFNGVSLITSARFGTSILLD
jgi:hypothetical protein